MKLSRTVAYALQATLQLAETDSQSPVPCSKLAAKGDMPERFLLQVLRNLVTHGILRSTRGVDGGYTLVRPADQISLLEIIEAIDGPMDSRLPLETEVDTSFQENLKEALANVTSAMRQQLADIKISKLVTKASSGNGRPVIAPHPHIASTMTDAGVPVRQGT
ncbi:Rrf2 family transcriptional regulator [Blastopirellula sp. JC732]|uniref:Rrf2 family transcriptional regulator n=1 Tax=Blastopirellula sediminis TaxID=2894196 RepID=A0A9X1MQT0_9BACT|nr:Rrf2 family transcriptional regulator [Blastopirellula sediminis]MCC9604912.1 Rrf2 family transcriptional regulator [Blastopirellula sediminis]MCC9631788.1 Rrf2 family transcriptional regulator [Blastopirellula sediminis]